MPVAKITGDMLDSLDERVAQYYTLPNRGLMNAISGNWSSNMPLYSECEQIINQSDFAELERQFPKAAARYSKAFGYNDALSAGLRGQKLESTEELGVRDYYFGRGVRDALLKKNIFSFIKGASRIIGERPIIIALVDYMHGIVQGTLIQVGVLQGYKGKHIDDMFS